VAPDASRRQHLAPHAAAGDFVVQFAGELVQFARVLSVGFGAVTACLCGGAPFDPHALQLVRVVRLEDGFVVEVPARAALGRPQGLGAFGAGRAYGREGVPAGDEDLFLASGAQVGLAELDRADAAAVVDGELAHHVAGEWCGQALCAGAGLGHSVSLSPGSVVVQVVR